MRHKIDLISELEAKNHELTNAAKSKEIQNELTNLRESDEIKTREIMSLRFELAKTVHDIKQREEEIILYQRVLKVRSELIASMQEKEESSDVKIADLYAEMGKQSTYINKVHNELAEKADELQQIFTNLDEKKLELARQEEIMNQLEESNQKSYEIQKAQVLHIQKLDAELNKMKETVQVYEKHLLSINDTNRNHLANQHKRQPQILKE